MNDWYRAWLVEMDRRTDEAAEAEKYRLLKRTGLIRPKTPKSYWRLLYHLGALLTAWGKKLQSHYEEWIRAQPDHSLPKSMTNPRVNHGL
ncbi:MAG: hypothetical protein ACM3PY_17135 [Omnitrophica WOR_2 bacterium]